MASFGTETVEAAIKRIKDFFSIHTDTELSRKLDLTKSGLSSWKTRGSLDIALIKEKMPNISIDWLLTGAGEPSIKENPHSIIMDEIEKLKKSIYSPIHEGIIGKLDNIKEPVEAYNRTERVRVPLYYSDTLKVRGYYYSDYLFNESIIIIELTDVSYEVLGFAKCELLVIDKNRQPMKDNYIVIEASDEYIIAKFGEDEKGQYYKNEIEDKMIYLINENHYIVGTVIAKIKSMI